MNKSCCTVEVLAISVAPGAGPAKAELPQLPLSDTA